MKAKDIENKILIVISLVLIGINLRPSIAAIGPLLPFIQHDISLNFTQISLLTMLPILTMGIAMFWSSILTQKYDSYKLISCSLFIIGISSFLRLFISINEAILILSAVSAGCGIAIIQAILPSIIKQNWPNSTALYMGLYVSSIMGGAALAAALVGKIEYFFNSWKIALSIWFFLAILALIFWTSIRSNFQYKNNVKNIHNDTRIYFYRIPRVWILGLFFGLGTASYTCIFAWLPPYYIEFGWTNTKAGLLLASLSAFEVFAGLVFPIWASRNLDRRLILTIIVMCSIIGYVGLIFSPTNLTLIWIIFLGMGVGGLFPMSLIVAMDHYTDPQHAGALTAFVQGCGYILASFSPFFAGIIRDYFGSFQISWSILLFLTCFLMFLIPLFNPNKYADIMDLK